MKLSTLVQNSGAIVSRIVGESDVLRPCSDTRTIEPGDLFFCMPSRRTDTHQLLKKAAQLGAVAAVLHDPSGAELAAKAGLPYIEIAGLVSGFEGTVFNEAAWRLAHTLADHPSRQLKVIGVTGTNGKTTTAWLVRDMLNALGESAGYLGTLGYQDARGEIEIGNTTPFSVELVNLLSNARDRRVTAIALEVSSHALEERRADGVEFDAAIFTNLTQDHLDFHGSMESYEASKWRLFSEIPSQSQKKFGSALNLDDEVGASWSNRLPNSIGYSLQPRPGEKDVLHGEALLVSLESLTLRLNWRGRSTSPMRINLGGSFNVVNCLAASAGLLAADYSLEDVERSLPSVHAVPGRFEAIRNERGIGVIVDYAHTPDALEKLLDSVRALGPRKVITVFGCGGDRDRSKRPKMARAASERSDLTIVTSDNPRTENPATILKEVSAGVVPDGDSLSIIDRREAIHRAIAEADAGDVVVIAGKGHENYQIIGHTKHPMDDREMAREALRHP